MEDYIKATKQKIKQLEKEISDSSATINEKRNMQHSLSKINIFSDDVFDDAVRYKSAYSESKSILNNKIELLQEDLESVHLWLDDQGVPREDSSDIYSIVGRIKQLKRN